MKYILVFFLAAGLLASCQNSASEPSEEVPTDDGGSQDDADLVAINDAIHGFYHWYEANLENLANINYVSGGQPATLDQAALDNYYEQLRQSGYISQSYIDNDRAYLTNLEATAWKNEDVNEGPLSGLDYDRFVCAQDYDMEFWQTAPIGAEGLGTDRVTATMSGSEGGSPREQQFDMVKEYGSWKIAKIHCDTGQ